MEARWLLPACPVRQVGDAGGAPTGVSAHDRADGALQHIHPWEVVVKLGAHGVGRVLGASLDDRYSLGAAVRLDVLHDLLVGLTPGPGRGLPVDYTLVHQHDRL